MTILARADFDHRFPEIAGLIDEHKGLLSKADKEFLRGVGGEFQAYPNWAYQYLSAIIPTKLQIKANKKISCIMIVLTIVIAVAAVAEAVAAWCLTQ